MKMVKSLLLGSAAGLVAVTAGQAADLPVKAKPVEYVKVCSLYGAGFYYMPGTDMCIKIGGWVRTEFVWGGAGSLTWGPFAGNSANWTTSNQTFRARGYITADAREQTAYGTARAYIDAGINTNDSGLQVPDLALSSNRAFLQWAGITTGLTQSFYDFFSVPAAAYRGGYFPASDTGDPGWLVVGYTAQFGNGLSASISTESRRTTQVYDQVFAGPQANSNAFGTLTPGSFTTGIAGATGAVALGNGAYGGYNLGDFVGNLRLDQTWGSAQVMAALHNDNTNYYGTSATTGVPAAGVPGAGLPNPDAWGYAVGAGLRLNFPMIAQGDYFQSQVNYTQGALRYLFFTPNSNWGKVNGSTQSFGVLTDCVFGGTAFVPGTQTGCNRTTAWGINASYEHYWTPAVHESFYGDYYAVSYNNQANNMLCSAEGFGAGVGTGAVAAVGCNNNWSTWGVGSRLQWDITKSFYIGVEGLYDFMKSASAPGGITAGSEVAFGSATQVANQHNWDISLRMHKDFLP